MRHALLVVERVDAAETFPLRLEVLGRGRQPSDLARPDDLDATSAHFAVRDRGAVIGTGTVRRREPPFAAAQPGWQIRGMAVREEDRGRGIGTLILAAIVDHVEACGGGVVWCHARVAATSLYRRAGFESSGPPLDDHVAGPQLLMWRVVRPPAPAARARRATHA